MIDVAGVDAKGDLPTAKGGALLTKVTFAWQAGVLAVLGAPYDGTTLLLSVLAGISPIRAGNRGVKGPIAYVPVDVVLPDALTVEEVCDLADRVRGEGQPRSAAATKLAVLGLEALAKRRVRTLSPVEARGVAFAVALSSAARVILLEEPLAFVEPTVPSRIISAIRERAAEGACVVVTTASVRDATRVADQLAVLTRGVYAPLPPALAHVGREGASVRVVIAPTADARAHAAALVGALAEHASVSAIDAGSTGPHGVHPPSIAVHVRGPDLLALSTALTNAIASTHIQIDAIESAVMPLDAIRATLAAPRPGALPQPASMPPGPPVSAPPPPPVQAITGPPPPNGPVS